MIKGTLVLIPFPFTDLKGNKVRPAIVLYATELDATVCFITSELKWKDEFDFIIYPSSENRIKITSLVRVSKIATIDNDLILGELGQLNEKEIKELNDSLIRLFKIK